MECRLKCEKPGDIVYTMTITATAESWEKLRVQLHESKTSYLFPADRMIRQIDDLLGQARKIYWPREASALPNGDAKSASDDR